MGYTVLVFLREKNSENATGVKLYRLINELALSHLFYFVAAILVHILVPKRFPALLIFFYAVMLGVEVAGTRLEKDILNKTAFWVQSFVLGMLWIQILTDDWCRFYLYRGHA